MNIATYSANSLDAVFVDVAELNGPVRDRAARATIGENLKLSTAGLEGYFFTQWQPDLVDLLVVAGAAEFCDVIRQRQGLGWARAFDVRVCVHRPELWNSTSVKTALQEALGFLTGDVWRFSFVPRLQPFGQVRQRTLDLESSAKVIMPYSDGLDSRAVAALIKAELRDGLVRVRLGSRGVDTTSMKRRRDPFTTVPYDVRIPQRQKRESSARSRGFKFAVITGIAAHLANVTRVIVTESGQGALGPVLAVTGHIYPDYRVHPAFTRRVEQLFLALTGRAPKYEFPRIWHTKAETLAAASSLPSPPTWLDTRSCWQQSRQVSLEGKRRQCGICAACMLRRMSMHAAGIHEPEETYVWENLSAPEYKLGAAAGFTLFTRKLEEYAIAGVLHLDHLAGLSSSDIHARTLRSAAREAALALEVDLREAEDQLHKLLKRHRAEWCDFVHMLGRDSFVAKLASVP